MLYPILCGVLRNPACLENGHLIVNKPNLYAGLYCMLCPSRACWGIVCDLEKVPGYSTGMPETDKMKIAGHIAEGQWPLKAEYKVLSVFVL